MTLSLLLDIYAQAPKVYECGEAASHCSVLLFVMVFCCSWPNMSWITESQAKLLERHISSGAGKIATLLHYLRKVIVKASFFLSPSWVVLHRPDYWVGLVCSWGYKTGSVGWSQIQHGFCLITIFSDIP